MKSNLQSALRRLSGSLFPSSNHQLSEEWLAVRYRAEQGDAEAQFDLGIGYASGSIGLVDHTEAAKWLLKAAEQGDENAQFAIGAHFQRGAGVPEDHVLAVQWYRKAAEQGNRTAPFNLGYCYEVGEGVTKDLVEAFAWYSLWLKNDSDPEAVKACADLAKSMTSQQISEANKRTEELRAQISAKLRSSDK